MGVNLVGVVHEKKGVREFQPYLNSSIYLDEEVRPILSNSTRVGTFHNFSIHSI